MKRTGVARTPLRKSETLRGKIEAQLAALRRTPRLLRSFFKAPVSPIYRLVSNLTGASSAGSIVWYASMVGASPAAGASISASACEVRQPLAAQALRLRSARDRPPANAARLLAHHRAGLRGSERLAFTPRPVDPFARIAEHLPFEASDGRSCESARAIGTGTIVASGTRSSAIGTETTLNLLPFNAIPRP